MATKTRSIVVRSKPEYIPKNLVGMCAIASHKLSTLLSKQNIGHAIVVNEKHVWVDIDGLVIDITSSQFTGEPIPLIIDRKHYDLMRKKWKISGRCRRFTCHEKLIKYLRKSGWPEPQIPG